MTLTKSDLSAIEKVVGDKIHDTITEYHAGMILPEFKSIAKRFDEVDKRFNKIDKRFCEVDKRFDEVDGQLAILRTEQRYIKDDIKGINAELAMTPSRSDFLKLKAKVDRHHPTN